MAVKIRTRKLSDGTRTVYLDIYREGAKRQVESLPLRLTGDRKADKLAMQTAEAMRSKKELELIQTANGLRPLQLNDLNFIEHFKITANQKTKQTAKVWNNTLKLLIEFAGPNLRFNDINKDFAERFQNFLIKKVSPNTTNIYFSKVKAALNQAVADELIPINPIDKIKNVPKVETRRDFLTIDEVRTLANTPCGNEEVKRAFLFACFTGLRLSDVRLLVHSNIKGSQIVFRQKKTQVIQYLPLSSQALSLLGKINNSNETVFTLPNDARILVVLDNWAKKAKLMKKVSFHVSRHTFATLALTHGADLYTVSKLLGHTDLKHTQIYAKIVDEKKNSAVEAIPGL